jgi:hypothetical protein
MMESRSALTSAQAMRRHVFQYLSDGRVPQIRGYVAGGLALRAVYGSSAASSKRPVSVEPKPKVIANTPM